MNIILKGFDDSVSKPMTEAMTRGLALQRCISIGDHPARLPDLGEAQHIWMSADQLRKGQYPQVDWNAITPLDEELIDAMRHCEVMFLKMVERYAIYDDLSYDDRKRQFLRHLRYWNHTLDAMRIEYFILRGPPHQAYDLVIYDLCKYKGIRTISICPFHALDFCSVEENWTEVGKAIRTRYEELKREYADETKKIPLSDELEGSFMKYTQGRKEQWYMKNIDTRLNRPTFVGKWASIIWRLAYRKPAYLLQSLLSVQVWKRKLGHHATRTFYDRFARQPDLTVPYVYVPLQMQPEASTCPMGGAYVDQELMVHMLAACLPEGVRMYIKENPKQGERMRSKEFYQALLDIPSVAFVPRDSNTFDLIEHAVAVAAVTGTACFEGLFRGKPAIMFGHKYFQYAPGVHRVHSLQDCRRAIQEIFVHNNRPTPRDMRLYLKAIEDTAQLGFRREPSLRPPETYDERAAQIGAYVRDYILQQEGLSL